MGWIVGLPGAFELHVWGLLGCSGNPYACDPTSNGSSARRSSCKAANPRAANEAWAGSSARPSIRRSSFRLSTRLAIDFVSKRLGNYQNHPLFGMLISQVWVR